MRFDEYISCIINTEGMDYVVQNYSIIRDEYFINK